MTEPLPEPRSWSAKRWWITAILVFATQVGLILYLSDRQLPKARTPRPTPALQVTGPEADSVLALMNPTLFALPQVHGFSGLAWMRVAQPEFKPMDWSEPPRWLDLPVQDLAANFRTYLNTRLATGISVPAQPAPELTSPSRLEFPGQPAFSCVEVEGDLNERQLLTPMQLESRPFLETLTNSMVQAAIDEHGQPVSVSLLASSTDPQADRLALSQTRAAVFKPAADALPFRVTPPDKLRWAVLRFYWHPLAAPPATR